MLDLPQPDLGLEAGRYLALLSHSGSRGSGAQVASHYSKLARDLHPELPRELWRTSRGSTSARRRATATGRR